MRVNKINTINYISYKPAFKHTAVPYPEYQNKLQNTKPLHVKFSEIINELFNPTITKDSQNIKKQIDDLYQNKNNSGESPKKSLISVFA